MFATNVNEWGFTLASATLGAVGTSITPGNNAFGSYVQLLSGAAVTDDICGFWITFDTVNVSGSARDCLANVGTDPAGGSSFGAVVSSLLCSCAGSIAGQSGVVSYWFPLGVKAGSSIGVQLSVNNATVGTGNAFIKVYGRPSRPELVRVGSFVRTYGATVGSSSGTAITPGTAAKSAYVQLGTTADPIWFLNFGVGCNNNTMSNNAAVWDLAVGNSTNKRNVITDQLVVPNTAEALYYTSPGAFAQVASGDNVYARAGGAGGSPTGMSAVAYGVGG